MSYFDDASLVMIPSGYKDQKVYSVKPLDGSGDLTFARASSATRVASNGLIEKVRTNLFPTGSALLATGWTSVGATLTAGQTDPNGGTTALRVQLAAGGSPYSYILQSFTGSAFSYARSVFIKGATAQAIRIVDPHSGAGTTVNLTTSYQRFTAVGAGVAPNFGIQFDNNNDAAAKDFTIAFVQIEEGDIATDYIATTSAAVSVGPVSGLPRLDYLNSTCPRLLLEPQRTNIAIYSEQFDNPAGWTLYNGTQVANTTETLDPSGYYGAEKAIMGATNSATYRKTIGGLTNGDTYTFSLYIKQGSGVTAFLDICDASGTPDITPTSEWVRYTKTGVWNTAFGFVDIELRGTLGSYCYIWGAQLEKASYATSYIPTLGTSVTRVAETVLKTGISSLIGQTEGTMFVEIDTFGFNNFDRFIALQGTTSSDRFLLLRNLPNDRLYFYVEAGGSMVINQAGIAGTNVLGRHKIAAAYKSGSYTVYLDGVEVYSSAATSIPAMSQVFVGTSEDGLLQNTMSGGVKQALVFKTRLTNAQLAELTTL